MRCPPFQKTSPPLSFDRDGHFLTCSRYHSNFPPLGALCAHPAMRSPGNGGDLRARLLSLSGGSAACSGVISAQAPHRLAAPGGSLKRVFPASFPIPASDFGMLSFTILQNQNLVKSPRRSQTRFCTIYRRRSGVCQNKSISQLSFMIQSYRQSPSGMSHSAGTSSRDRHSSAACVSLSAYFFWRAAPSRRREVWKTCRGKRWTRWPPWTDCRAMMQIFDSFFARNAYSEANRPQ